MENGDRAFTNLEEELVHIMSELGMAPESHRDFGWLKELILMTIDNPLISEEEWLEYIGSRVNITRERVRQILHKAVWNHWTVNSRNTLKELLRIDQVKFRYVKPDHVEFIRLISDVLREKHKVLP